MNVQGSAFYFGNQADATEAQLEPFFRSLTVQNTSSEWPLHRPFVEGYAYRRRLFCNESTDAWCGVVLSARATEFHHYVQQVGNVVTVVARETGPNAPVEVNFFCIRKDSNKGIYSNYYGSYAFGSFLSDLWASYRFFVEQAREAHIQSVRDKIDEDDLDEARKPYSLRGRAQYAPLYNPSSFEQLVRQLTEVAEVRLTTYSVDAPADQPVSNRINNVHKVYRLEEGHQSMDRTLLSWILKQKLAATRVLKSGTSSFSGSVLGTKADGESLTVPFTSALDDHLKFNYDNIGSFDVSALSTNPCLAEMLSKLRTAILFRPPS